MATTKETSAASEPLILGNNRPVGGGDDRPVVSGKDRFGRDDNRPVINGDDRSGRGDNQPVVNGGDQPVVNGGDRLVLNGDNRPVLNGYDRPVVNGGDRLVLNGDNRPVLNGYDRPVVNGGDQPVVNGGDRIFVRGGNRSIRDDDDRPIFLEKGIKGSVVTVNRTKHYAFIKRRDKPDCRDLFVRQTSVVGNMRDKKLFVSDLCKFDIIRTKRGFEAVNVHIIDRAVNSIAKLPKIPKKKQAPEQSQVSSDFFRSTITDLFREALKNKK